MPHESRRVHSDGLAASVLSGEHRIFASFVVVTDFPLETVSLLQMMECETDFFVMIDRILSARVLDGGS